MEWPREAKSHSGIKFLGVSWEPNPPDRQITSHSNVIDKIRFVMAAILDFHLQGWDYCWNNDSTVFSVFQNMGVNPKIVFLCQILRNLHDFMV